jgi:hypothetical protein
MAAERQNRVVVLLKVNFLAAAQTEGHVSGASPIPRVIELPFVAFAQRVPQLFHFTAGLERNPAFPSRWRGPGSIAGDLRGVWVRAVWRARPSARPEWGRVTDCPEDAITIATVGGMFAGLHLPRGPQPEEDHLVNPSSYRLHDRLA